MKKLLFIALASLSALCLAEPIRINLQSCDGYIVPLIGDYNTKTHKIITSFGLLNDASDVATADVEVHYDESDRLFVLNELIPVSDITAEHLKLVIKMVHDDTFDINAFDQSTTTKLLNMSTVLEAPQDKIDALFNHSYDLAIDDPITCPFGNVPADYMPKSIDSKYFTNGTLIKAARKKLDDEYRCKILPLETVADWQMIELHGHTSAVCAVAFSPDNMLLISGSADKNVRIWDVLTGKCLRVCEGHEGCVNSVKFSPHGHVIATGSDDGTVRIWDVQTGKCVKVFEELRYSVNSVDFSPDGKFIVVGSGNAQVRIWDIQDIQNAQCVHMFYCGENLIHSVAWSPNGELIAVADDHKVGIWGIAAYRRLNTFSTDRQESMCSVAWSPDSKFILTGSRDKTVRIWSLQNTKEVFKNQNHQEHVNSVAWSSNGRFMISGSNDGTACIWDAQMRGVTLYNGDRIYAVAWSPNGQFIATGSGTIANIRWWSWNLNVDDQYEQMLFMLKVLRNPRLAPEEFDRLQEIYAKLSVTAREWVIDQCQKTF